MYERFTDRARKAMQLANQEAQRFNHEYIGTEHVLLGLVKEGLGVAAKVLQNKNVDLKRIRLEIERIVQHDFGADHMATGRLPQTPRVKKAIQYAVEEVRGLNSDYVGTEHLLIGLLREQEGVAAQVLIHLGLNLEDARDEVLNLWAINVTDETIPDLPTQKQLDQRIRELEQKVEKILEQFGGRIISLDAEKPKNIGLDDTIASVPERSAELDHQIKFTQIAASVLQKAWFEAMRFSDKSIGTGHILLAMLKKGSNLAATVLMNLGVQIQQVCDELEKIAPRGSPTQPNDSEGLPAVTIEGITGRDPMFFPSSKPVESLSTQQIELINERIRLLNAQKDACVVAQDFVKAEELRQEVIAMKKLMTIYLWQL